MELEEIGFYTLSDKRAKESSAKSPLWRGELLLTDLCNFKCPYCRGLKKEYQGNLGLDESRETVELLIKEGLKNVRFSGGEPTIHEALPYLISVCKQNKVERIAISTNGSSQLHYYKYLIECGVDDFSISLDSCCANVGRKMMGISDSFSYLYDRVINNIRELSKLTYVTVGIVWNEINKDQIIETVKFVHSLGVADIRIISSAQFNQNELSGLDSLPKDILEKHPILNYRINRFINNLPIRGLSENDSSKCKLVLDDMAIVKGWHFPCIIYLREGGNPIGKVGKYMREDREKWYLKHNSFDDKICKNNCLDVCVAFNNKAEKL